MAIARYAQITWNNNFAISEEKSEGWSFYIKLSYNYWHCQSWWAGSVMPKVPKITNCKIFAISQEWSDVLIELCHGYNVLHMSIKDWWLLDPWRQDLVINFSEFGLGGKFSLLAIFLHKSHIWRYLVPEIWVTVLLTNQIAAFLNQLCL